MKALISMLMNIIKSFFVAPLKQSGSTKATNSVIGEAKKVIEGLNIDNKHSKTIPNPTSSSTIAPSVKIKRERYVVPLSTVITSNFGIRKLGGVTQFHAGHDYSAHGKWGAEVFAPEDGTVIMNKIGTGGVTFVAIHGKYSGAYIYLCHIGSTNNKPSPLVRVGQQVSAGQTVGYVNSSGYVTGPHLHLSIYTAKWVNVDPMCYWRKFAPHIAEKITNYVDKGQVDKSNKTGRKCADL